MGYCTCGENKGRCIDCAEYQIDSLTLALERTLSELSEALDEVAELKRDIDRYESEEYNRQIGGDGS